MANQLKLIRKLLSYSPCQAVSFVALLLVFALHIQGQTKPQPSPAAATISGILADGLYRNNSFGFAYKLRYGWVDRTKQMRDISTDSAKEQVLLAVFEHPPEVKNDAINPTVIIAAENLSSYPGIKTAADYFDPLSEAATAQGLKIVNEPYATSVGTKSLVRADFSKEIDKVTMYQSSLVMLSKGYAVSFTFIGGSEDEVEQLIDHLSFSSPNVKR